MILHVGKLLWKRRQRYGLLGLELLVVFLVASVIFTSGVYLIDNYIRPAGFSYENVWAVNLVRKVSRHVGGGWTQEDSVFAQQMYRALKEFGEVEAIGEAEWLPFMGTSSYARNEVNGRAVDCQLVAAGAELKEVLRPDIISGRWFDSSDDAGRFQPVVINRYLAQILFGNEDPIGKSLPWDKPGHSTRIVGVVLDYRIMGPLAGPYCVVLSRLSLDRPIRLGIPTALGIRVRPGTPRSFERRIHEKLQALNSDWDASVNTLEEQRRIFIREKVQSVLIYLLLGSSILLFVALSLVGVLWQSVTQRIKEIGIRRATGADARHIHAQFTGEMLVLTTGAVIIGAVLVAHSAVLDLFPEVRAGVYIAGLLSAAAILYLLVIGAALYPGWLATRVQPAEALHCE